MYHVTASERGQETMALCLKCGLQNLDSHAYCAGCGSRLGSTTATQPAAMQQPIPPISQKSSAGKIIAVVVVVIVVMVVLIGAFILIGNTVNRGTLVVYVHNSHFAFTIDYRVYVNSQLKDSGSLSPGQELQYTYSVVAGSYNVYADSTGGGTGATSDSESVYVDTGTTQRVDLTL